MRLVPRFKSRIENYSEIKDFGSWYSDYCYRIEIQNQLFKMLRENEDWINFLKLSLELGNRIAKNTTRGQAKGINILSLKSFINYRANDRVTNLFDYMIQKMYKVHNNIAAFDFLDDFLKRSTEVSKFNTEDCLNDIRTKKSFLIKLFNQIESAKKSIPPDIGFVNFHINFYNENIEKINNL